MRQALIGVMAVVMCGVAGRAAAQETPRVKTEHRGEEAVVSLSSGDLTVTQTIARDVVQFRLHARGYEVSIAADPAGRITVGRGNTATSYSIRTASGREQAAVRELLATSPAWRRFDAVMRSAWGTSSKPSRAFRPAHALMWLLQGDLQPLMTLASTAARPAATVTFVRQDCDIVYSRRLDEIYNELVSCLETWNPLQTAWCAYEYNFKLVWAGWEYAECLI